MPYLQTRSVYERTSQAPSGYSGSVQTGFPDSVTATTTALGSLTRTERRDLITDENWQKKVRYADRNGPGILGASLDMPAATSMLLDLCVRRRTARGWEIVKDDPVITALLQLWRGSSVDQRVLFSRLIRILDGPASAYLGLHNAQYIGTGRMFWQLAQTTQVKDNRDGTTAILGRPNARRGDEFYSELGNQWIYHVMNADLEWDGMPWSQMRRGLPHLEQYKATMRTMSRTLDSQLALNGILWAKAVGKATSWPDAIKTWAMKAVTSDDGVESVAPFPMSTEEEPKFIETGRNITDSQIRLAEFFLKAFAQSTDLPTQMLLEGPGQGNQWNAYLEGDFYADMVVAPRWQRACTIITETHLRPLLRGLPRTASHLNPDDLEVWADDTRIRSRTDNSAKVIESGRMGIANRHALAEAAQLSADQVIDLPDGMTEFEWWLLTQNPQLARPDVQNFFPGAPDIVPGELDNAIGQEPDRDEALDRVADAVEQSMEPPDPDMIDAQAAVSDELGRTLPKYWNDLVPTVTGR